MESLLNKFLEFEQLEEEIKNIPPPEFVEGIVIDENHQLSEDAKFGNELAKDKIAWYKYFGI